MVTEGSGKAGSRYRGGSGASTSPRDSSDASRSGGRPSSARTSFTGPATSSRVASVPAASTTQARKRQLEQFRGEQRAEVRFLADDDVRPPVAAERLDSRARSRARSTKPSRKSRASRSGSSGCSGTRCGLWPGSVACASKPSCRATGQDRLPAAEGDHVPGGACRLGERQQRLEMAAAAGEGEEDAHGMILRS